MKYVFLFVIAYIVLYSVVWLHEVGHALWYRVLGLKRDWWRVQVKPYIFFSTPGAIEQEKWQSLKPVQHVLSAYGGMMANALFAVISGLVIRFSGISNDYVTVALWLFMTLHIGEIVSYLLVGSIFLVSDMQIVSQSIPWLRIPSILTGAALAVLYVLLLMNAPSEYSLFIIIWNVATVVSMCLGRIIATMAVRRRNG